MAVPTNSAAPSNRQGTGYTNLQTLMNANQGNQLGKAVGSGIQNTGQQVQNNLNQSQQNFNTQSQANEIGTDQDKENVQNTLDELQSNPSAGVNQQQIGQFEQYESGNYNGPQGLVNSQGQSDTSQLQGQASAAQQEGQAVDSAGGRQALLQKYVSNPSQEYGSGAQAVDTALLGATGGKQLQQARQSVAGLGNQVNNAANTAQQQAQQYQQQAQSFGQQVVGQLQNAQSALYTPAAAEAAQYNANAPVLAQQAQATITEAAPGTAGNETLSPAAMQALGLTQGEKTYGANLAGDITYQGPAGPATALNVMTQPQLAQYSGLSQLMGQSPVANQNPYTPGQLTYNQSGAQTAIQQAQQNFNTAIAPGLQQANALVNNGNFSSIQDVQNYANSLAKAAQSSNTYISGLAQAALSNITPILNSMNSISNQYGGVVDSTTPVQQGAVGPKLTR
jgi:hypothetical protein